MKTQALSLAVLVAGGCFIAAISGYGGGEKEHKHGNCSHDHGKKETLESVAGKESPVYSLSKDQISRLGIEVGVVEMRQFSSLDSAAVSVPAAALITDSGGDMSVLFSDSGNKKDGDQKFAPVKVKVGTISDGYVEIKSGLFPGDSVIVKNAPLIKLANGEKEPVESLPITAKTEVAKGSSDVPNTKVQETASTADENSSRIKIEEPNETDLPKSVNQPNAGLRSGASVRDSRTASICPSRCKFEAEPRIKIYPCPHDYDNGVHHHGQAVDEFFPNYLTCPSGHDW